MVEVVSRWLRRAEKTLSNAGIETPRLDVLVLLCDEIGKDKSWILTYPDYEIQGSVLEKLNTKLAQRAAHTPLAYLRGHAEFYGREFAVNEHVLVPRPESEAMIELLKQEAGKRKNEEITVWDVGTGSGCLAITAILELPGSHVFGSDSSEAALAAAKQNAAAHKANATFMQADLLHSDALSPMPDALFLLANLPYVPDDYPINKAAQHEPKLALFSGADGLDHYRRLFAEAAKLAHKPACIITESLMEQHPKLAHIAAAAGYRLAGEHNLAQCFMRRG